MRDAQLCAVRGCVRGRVEAIDRSAHTTSLSLARGIDPAGSDARGSAGPHVDWEDQMITRTFRPTTLGLALVVGLAVSAFAAATAVAVSTGTRQIPSGGTTTIRAGATGSDGIQQPEIRPGSDEEEGAGSFNRPRPGFKNGKFPKKPLDAPVVASSPVATSNPELGLSFEGLNHRDQRLANGGNQFSLEPPDQALCVGNGYTVESTNSVLRVWSTAGGPALTGVQDLNTFFGYPAAINRTTGAIGPNVIDPVCHYDPENQRFIVAITTLDVDANGDFNGKNTIDLAVSNTGDPTGAWTIYRVPAQNDGTDGTPDHGCTLDGTAHGPCFQDYPHIGADANGVYVTTNEYDLFGPSFNAAQIFAFSKTQLAAHPASIDVTLVENLNVDGSPGFTVWPATSPAGQYSSERNGTEYLLSTDRRRRLGDRQPDGHRPPRRPLGADEHEVARHVDAVARHHEPAGQQPDVCLPAQVRPEARRLPARAVHQRHHPADDLRPRVLATPLRRRAGARRGHLDTGLARLPDAADVVRERHALGRVGHRGAGRR